MIPLPRRRFTSYAPLCAPFGVSHSMISFIRAIQRSCWSPQYLLSGGSLSKMASNFDFISLSYSMTIILSFTVTYIVDISNFLYQSELYAIALTLLSIVLISYYNDVLFCFCVLIYQIGSVNNNWKALSGLSTMFTAICFAYVAFGVISKKLPSKLSSMKEEKIIISSIADYNTTTIEDNGYESN